ncbi:MAG: hypothetical protein QNJ32_01635 [Xenococcaceae cyanobacterium MO_167.B27]|nr:hypothetical protein [Xenococcaceae cyanobacterium MO_167.B27]
MTTYHQTKSLNRFSANKRPPRYKLFLLTWLGIYPLITTILHFLGEFLALLPLPIRTLVLTGTLVYLMTYWVMPMLMKLFRDWLK